MCCSCGGKAKFKRVSPKCVLTTVGEMRVSRRYYACPECGLTQTPLDTWAGLGSRMASEHARRVIVVAGSTWSFEQASEKLLELCRMRVSNDTIRPSVMKKASVPAAGWLGASPAQRMAKAAGELEFSSDGMKINTTGGWAEMRLSVVDKRESGEAAGPEKWADRVLPEPTARLAWCQIAPCRLIGARWAAMFKHLGVGKEASLSVIADGGQVDLGTGGPSPCPRPMPVGWWTYTMSASICMAAANKCWAKVRQRTPGRMKNWHCCSSKTDRRWSGTSRN